MFLLPYLLQIPWNPDAALFTIGNFTLYWYGLTWALSVLLGYLLTLYLYRTEGIDVTYVASLTEHIFIGGLIGARLGVVFFYEFDYYLQHPLEIPMIWKGGLASHGGVIGILLSVYWFSRKYPQLSYLKVLDFLALGSLLVGGLIRLGNLMNSEIVGKATDMPWGFIFIQRGETFARHPSPLYEVILCFGLLFFLVVLHRYKWRVLPTGTLLGLFFVLAFGGRILLEFLKENAVFTQLLSVPIVVLGVVLLVWIQKKPAFSSQKPTLK